ncbi:M16 family metallopeptidase [Brassicibacter mesophilus]|uniref:M16 family metallopeptidase n=1 Tax=Brassicibacter mesophilus TaxID=745119 RepID=UPI003D1AA8C3
MFNKIELKNGLRIVSEYIPHVKSVSIGIWVEAGSRREGYNNNGISHLIEHMLFKGTKNRTAKEIAESFDNIGGQLNAFTSKECTCYYAKVLDSHIQIAIEVLSDMIFNSKFDEFEIKKEKSVIFEEIKMYEDSPEDLVHDLLSQTIFNGNTLSLPILGTEDSLSNLTRDDIIQYFKKYYIPNNTVISIAGNFELEEIIELIKKYFGSWTKSKNNSLTYEKPSLLQRMSNRKKDIEQLHFCLGTEGISQGQDELYSLLVLNNILGGSMSSRLFQTIREERGLVYSIYSYPSSYKDIGIFTIYAALNPKHFLEAVDLIIKDIDLIKNEYLSEEEIFKSKEQLKGNYILGLESTSSRMTSIGKSELLLGSIHSPDQIIEKIDQVSFEDVRKVVNRIFDNNKFNIAYVGNIKDNNIKEKLKKICFE